MPAHSLLWRLNALRKSENPYTEIEFPGRYVLSESRFPQTADRIRNEEDKPHEPSPHQQ